MQIKIFYNINGILYICFEWQDGNQCITAIYEASLKFG